MPLQPIDPKLDSRVEHRSAVLNGCTYHYLYGLPPGRQFKATVFLIHGWPDLSLGWRYQIPLLLDMGFRVVAPDLMGFGGTDAPKAPPNPINLYGYKRASDDISELANQLGAQKIILGGHDWGGFVVWRAAQWHPELVSHVFSICTPYTAPHEDYISTEKLAQGPFPQLAYQIHLASGEVEKIVNSEQSIRQFLKGLYGAKGPNGEYAFDPKKGVLAENLPTIGESKLLNGETLDYYVKEYSRHGIHSTFPVSFYLSDELLDEFHDQISFPCDAFQFDIVAEENPVLGPGVNWYRTRKLNWEEDLALLDKKIITAPCLFIQATYDSVLTPGMAKGMDQKLPNLTRGEVAATHWALTQKPEEVNAIIKKWLQRQGFDNRSSL